jgi:hypothetical protein
LIILIIYIHQAKLDRLFVLTLSQLKLLRSGQGARKLAAHSRVLIVISA